MRGDVYNDLFVIINLGISSVDVKMVGWRWQVRSVHGHARWFGVDVESCRFIILWHCRCFDGRYYCSWRFCVIGVVISESISW